MADAFGSLSTNWVVPFFTLETVGTNHWCSSQS